MSTPSEIYLQGSNDPNVDVSLVQKAVEANDIVHLQGAFNFTGRETGPTNDQRIIEIRNDTRIVGELDAKNRRPVIIGGTRAFYVQAAGRRILFSKLRFLGSIGSAIQLKAAADVSIEQCRLDGITPLNALASGIVGGGVTGTLSILDNYISPDAYIASTDSSNGVVVTGPFADVEILRNFIQAATAHGIDVRDANCSVRIQMNQVSTGRGRSRGTGRAVDCIRCIGSGSHTVSDNQLLFSFYDGAAIRLGAVQGAQVNSNAINMSVSGDETPGLESAGIQVLGTSTDNHIGANVISGRARVALSVIHSDFPLDKPPNTTGDPLRTNLEENNHIDFAGTLADIEVGTGATFTSITAYPNNPNPSDGTILNRGTKTSVTGNYTFI
jgi:hypothetical protein